MKIDELITAIGGGAAFGWLARWLQSRESRLAVEAKATAELEREKARTTGETRVVELREEHETGRATHFRAITDSGSGTLYCGRSSY